MTMEIRCLLIISVTIALYGCAPPVLKPPRYEKEVHAASEMTARVVLQSDAKLPRSYGDSATLEFNLEDQRIFVDACKQELERLGLFRKVTKDFSEPADVEIKIVFVRTSWDRRFHIYTLDVVMQIDGRKNPFTRRYSIVSAGHDSYDEMMHTNAADGKEKAGRRLLSAVIQDVEKWLLTR